jgi:2-methylaconitate cis-trans-isomerase PrpF
MIGLIIMLMNKALMLFFNKKNDCGINKNVPNLSFLNNALEISAHSYWQMMLIDAEQLGKTGHETASELDQDLEHPTGKMTIDLATSLSNSNPVIRKAVLVRTARKVFEGYSCIPKTIWVNNLT